jgi:ribosomal protein S16
MSETTLLSPNSTLGAVQEHTAVNPLDSTIADKMSAMLSARDAQRKLSPVADDAATGTETEAKVSAPVAPDDSEAIVEPEDSDTPDQDADSQEGPVAPEEEVTTESESDSTAEELIDFLEFTQSNPNAKFKFMRNGKEVVIDAKKAASILGQGAAISEEARELKIQRAEFEEFQKEKRSELDNLTLAMTYTVQPRVKQAYDEIAKTQGYQTIFQQQLDQTQDLADRARIEASMAQNEQWIQQQSATIRQLQPQLTQFREQHKHRVEDLLEQSRRQFKDKELKNSFVFNELREKIGRDWTHAKTQLVPGVDTLDIITSDEHILSLLRDGLKYRDKPKTTTAGASIAALTGKKATTTSQPQKRDDIAKLREQANKGDRKASQNLLELRMQQIRSGRR